MPIIHAIILGILQGLTEFLPISSSGHLTLLPEIMGWNDNLTDAQYKTFEVSLHAGTLIAAVSYLWADVVRIVKGVFTSLASRELNRDGKFGIMLLVSAIPGAFFGAVFEEIITEKFGSVPLVAFMIIFFAVVLFASDRIHGRKTTENFTFADAAGAGLAQAVALIPGTSRSGISMSYLRARGYSRGESARLSFLMLIPIVAGATLFTSLKTAAEGGIPSQLVMPMIVGFVVSAVVGWCAVFGLLKLLKTHSFTPFVIYRLVVGVSVFAWYFAK